MKSSVAFLRSIEILSPLENTELEALDDLFRLVAIEPGETLFAQNDPGDAVFIVEEGRIVSSVTGKDGNQIEVAEFGPGDFFGEMAIFDRSPRSATCTAKEHSELLCLSEDDFLAFEEANPGAAIKVMRRMLRTTAERLENSGVFLSEMVQWGDSARKRAVTDEMTGLFNRRFIDEAVSEQLAHAQTAGTPLTLVMADLDHFTSINNDYGHEVGDEVIKSVVPVLRRHFRESDLLARYGGDEFIFLLPETPAEEAHQVCEAVCREVAALDVLAGFDGSLTRVTTSQGIASYPHHGRTVKALREAADSALYDAKEQGRNRAVIRRSTG
ncbi:MAG: diguanylate cyclase [Spirochaetota bacterium]